MTTQTTVIGATALLALLLWAMPLRAEPGCDGGPMGGGGPGMRGGGPGMGAGPDADPGMMFGMVLRSAGLTPEQRTQVHGIMEAHRPRFQELFGQLRSTNEAMSTRLLKPGTLTLEELQPQIDQITRLREQIVLEGTRVALDLRGVLTPEQLAKASDVSQRMQALRAEMKSLLGDAGPP